MKKADGKVDEKVDAKVDKKFDNTDLESFAQVKSQKDRRWGSIAKEELVWYRSFPALVVPPVLHLTVNSDIQIPTHDGVMTYGPSAKGVTPARKREYTQQVYMKGNEGGARGQGAEVYIPAGILLEGSGVFHNLFFAVRRVGRTTKEGRKGGGAHVMHGRSREEGVGTHVLLALVIWPLTTRPFRDGPPFLVLRIIQ